MSHTSQNPHVLTTPPQIPVCGSALGGGVDPREAVAGPGPPATSVGRPVTPPSRVTPTSRRGRRVDHQQVTGAHARVDLCVQRRFTEFKLLEQEERHPHFSQAEPRPEPRTRTPDPDPGPRTPHARLRRMGRGDCFIAYVAYSNEYNKPFFKKVRHMKSLLCKFHINLKLLLVNTSTSTTELQASGKAHDKFYTCRIPEAF